MTGDRARLPGSAPAEGRATPDSLEGAIPGLRPARLLLVEDNALVRKLVVFALVGRGYDVVEAPDAEAALQLNLDSVLPFDLLVTDLVLPGINGYELAQRVLTTSPGMKLLFVSGYATPGTQPPIHGAGTAHFLQKPYSPPEILAAVALVLAAAPDDRPVAAPPS